jgi:hypothetical protein
MHLRRRAAHAVLAGTILGVATCRETEEPLAPRAADSRIPPAPNFSSATTDGVAVLVGAGDIAACDRTQDDATADLLDAEIAAAPDAVVFTLGDNAFESGSEAEFTDCYDPTWGRHKARTRPTPGNREYTTVGAPGYFGYFGEILTPFGDAARDPARGYYSYDVGAWHVVVLNDNVSMSAGSAQIAWLKTDLAASTKACTIAYWHEPLFWSSGSSGTRKPAWDALYAAGAEIVMNSDRRNYERFAPQTPDGVADPEYGVRAFIVGTGGAATNTPFGPSAANSEVRIRNTPGVLRLSLGKGTYAWQFVPIAGKTETDEGTGTCHRSPPSAASVLVGAGDIAACTTTDDDATADLLDGIAGQVFTLGDHAYESGTQAEYNDCYGPTWGRHKARTRPAPGNRDSTGAAASGYYTYFADVLAPFGDGAADPARSYYSYDLGDWHVVALNSNVPISRSSAQIAWLKADLAATTKACTIAYWHKPLFWSDGSASRYKPVWDVLYKAGVEIVMNADRRNYERFAPQTPDGIADPEYGVRAFIVGTGGALTNTPFGPPRANSEVRIRNAPGVLKLTLGTGSYAWEFVPIASMTAADQGLGTCHGPPAPLASVSVSPANASVEAGSTLQLAATLREASGEILWGRAVTWASSDPAVATVSASGLVTGVSFGRVSVTATSEGMTGTAAITVGFGRAQRPYTADSPWNTPIPADATVDPNSTAMIATIAANSTGLLRSSPNQYAYPVHFADATTPRVTLVCTGLVWVNAADGSAAKVKTKELPNAPIPLEARPGKGDDDQIIVIDTETGDEYDVYRFVPPNGCQNVTKYERGVFRDAVETTYISRGAGVPYLAGLIRPWEIAQGRIEHALAFAYLTNRLGRCVYPASKTDGKVDQLDVLPEGARLRLDPTLDVESIPGLDRTGRIIARALQEYGAYNIDNSGSNKLYPEDNLTANWGTTLVASTVSAIPIDRLQVLRLPDAYWAETYTPNHGKCVR